MPQKCCFWMNYPFKTELALQSSWKKTLKPLTSWFLLNMAVWAKLNRTEVDATHTGCFTGRWPSEWVLNWHSTHTFACSPYHSICINILWKERRGNSQWSCTREHDHCDLTCTFFFSPQAWRAQGSESIKAGDAGIKAVNVQWKCLLKTHYPDSLIFRVLWWDLTQGLLFPAVPLHLIFRKLETAVSDHIGLVFYLSLAVCTGYLKAMVVSFSCGVHHRFNKWKYHSVAIS